MIFCMDEVLDGLSSHAVRSLIEKKRKMHYSFFTSRRSGEIGRRAGLKIQFTSR
jgi:hypothetical protein